MKTGRNNARSRNSAGKIKNKAAERPAEAQESQDEYGTGIQWFPGHMAKARRLLAENLAQVDVCAELVDARIPISSRNPEIDRLLGEKPRLILANKSDLADPASMRRFAEFYRSKGIGFIPVSSSGGTGVDEAGRALVGLMEEKIRRREERGQKLYTVKAMIVGIPNVGKSTFINRLCGRSAAQVGNRPGVTRGKQWLRAGDELLLLDTPGLLWPKFEDQRAALCLAATGAIKDDVIDRESVAAYLCAYLMAGYPGALGERYGIDEAEAETAAETAERNAAEQGLETSEISADFIKGSAILEAVAVRKGCLRKGGVADTDRACTMLLDDFRAGRLGRITLDAAPEIPAADREN